MKKILILSDAKPVQGGRAENTIFAYISKLILSKNFILEYFFLNLNGNLDNHINNKDIFNFLRKKNFNFKKKNIYLKKIFFFKNIFSTINTSLKYNLRNIKIKDNYKYDLLIALGHPAFYLSDKFKFKKRFFIMGDPPGERLYVYNKINFYNHKTIISFFRLFYSYICFKLENYYWKYKIDFKDTLIGIFGSATSERFKKIFKRSFVIDLRPAMPSFKNKNIYIKKKITKVVLAGSLGGSFAQTTLINFVNLLKFSNCAYLKYYLLGHEVENGISKNLISNIKNLKLMPSVNNFEANLSRMNIFIIPTEYYIGVRTRLCSALSAGNFCIVTKAVLLNMPELKSCKSVKVVKFNNKDIFRAIIKYHNLPYHKKLILNLESKRFFKKNYLYLISGKKFISQVV